MPLYDPQLTLRLALDAVGWKWDRRPLAGELELDEAMERYHDTAHLRLVEHEGRLRLDGSTLISKEQRFENQRLTTQPPEPSRIGRWKSDLSGNEIDTFEAVAGRMLRSLGYA